MDLLFETWMFMNCSRSLFETLMSMNWFIKKPLICFLNTNWTELMGQLMRQLMGINGENFLEHELFRNWTNEWKTKTGKTLALDANGSDEPLMLCRLEIPEQALDFSLPHHPPVGLHPSQGDKQNLFPAGTALWIHQVQSRSDWAVVRRSRWRIHRATIERFLSLPLFITLSLCLSLSSSLCLFDSLSLSLFD